MQPLTFEYYDIPPTICLIAGVIFGIKFSKLNSTEKLIALVLLMNIIADTAAYLLMHCELNYQYMYNILLPLERIVSLVIYTKNENTKKAKVFYGAGGILILLVYFIGYTNSDIVSELHFLSNTITALILTAMSYLHLRTISHGDVDTTRLITVFTIATFVYSAITVSALSALALALQIDHGFAADLFDINLIAYASWSITLIIAILWNKKT